MLMPTPENSDDRDQEWLTREERGSIPVMKAFVWLALHLGRRAVRLLLYPACLYYIAVATQARTDSRRYLRRVLGRPPALRDVFRHFHTFAGCVLDRIYLLNDQIDLFDLSLHGEDLVTGILERGQGCLLLGAHLGSFEVLRAVGRSQPALKVSMVMYEENARKVAAALNSINPELAMDVISLGRSHSLLTVERRLAEGQFVGVLADRGLGTEDQVSLPFLGAPAPFPEGPFRLAELLRYPAVLMFGIYRGGNRYEIHFEEVLPPEGGYDTKALMRHYAARLEHFCRDAPYNWFNFYDFWK